ncbi:hypothetical protein ACJX0J_013831, partial [Zea mays]
HPFNQSYTGVLKSQGTSTSSTLKNRPNFIPDSKQLEKNFLYPKIQGGPDHILSPSEPGPGSRCLLFIQHEGRGQMGTNL